MPAVLIETLPQTRASRARRRPNVWPIIIATTVFIAVLGGTLLVAG
jgi:hypothetical protein